MEVVVGKTDPGLPGLRQPRPGLRILAQVEVKRRHAGQASACGGTLNVTGVADSVRALAARSKEISARSFPHHPDHGDLVRWRAEFGSPLGPRDKTSIYVERTADRRMKQVEDPIALASGLAARRR